MVNQNVEKAIIGESVVSLYRDGADVPKPPYKGKAYNHPNAAFVAKPF